RRLPTLGGVIAMGMSRSAVFALATAISAALGLAACSGSSNSVDPVGTAPPPADVGDADQPGCSGACGNAGSLLGTAQVQRVLAQAVAEATALQVPATIAVVDRVGNVLAVYRMDGARPTVTIHSDRAVVGGLEGLLVPSELAAIAKAVTGAYL